MNGAYRQTRLGSVGLDGVHTNGDRGAEGGEGAVGADEGAIGPDGVGVDRQPCRGGW